MAEKRPDVLRETPLKWDDDPYGGVDITIMQGLLKMTPAERLRYAVASSNNVRRLVEAARKQR
jgi:hypothetical protein